MTQKRTKYISLIAGLFLIFYGLKMFWSIFIAGLLLALLYSNQQIVGPSQQHDVEAAPLGGCPSVDLLQSGEALFLSPHLVGLRKPQSHNRITVGPVEKGCAPLDAFCNCLST